MAVEKPHRDLNLGIRLQVGREESITLSATLCEKAHHARERFDRFS